MQPFDGPSEPSQHGLRQFVRPHRGGTGRFVYGRSQLSEVAVPGLLQYGALDDRFPDYSTIDQFLTEAEHLQLVALGEHVAEQMVRQYETGNSIQGCV